MSPGPRTRSRWRSPQTPAWRLLHRQQELLIAIEEAIAEVVARSRNLENAGEFASAEDALQAALISYPAAEPLIERGQELRLMIQARAEAERRSATIAEALESSRKLGRREISTAAEATIQAALTAYPEEEALIERRQALRLAIQARTEAQRRSAAIAEALERSRKLETSGDDRRR